MLMVDYVEVEANTHVPVYLSVTDIVHEMTLEVFMDEAYEVMGAVCILVGFRVRGSRGRIVIDRSEERQDRISVKSISD